MFCVCYVTTPSKEVARELSQRLVIGRLAACVNIIPAVTSVYRWEGRVCEEEEFLMMIKTRTALVKDVIESVRAHHPYSVPEVISVPISSGNDAYLRWVEDSTAEPCENSGKVGS
ncbi:putative CutA1 divalent ion tolerance protein [Trypanosoma vivax]|nr:divalent cation tolerance protein [Trypanosoma vivax]KAH8617630.1 putative CutA1 divalent ion tolerance protein [Trypanosoma vivax]